jgi:hypothetical protein
MRTLLISLAAISFLLVGCGNKSAATQNLPQRAIAAPKLKLVGLTSISGKNRALLKAEWPASSSGPAREQQLILSEHERNGQVEVLEIDVKSASARVSTSGVVTLLTLQDPHPGSF